MEVGERGSPCKLPLEASDESGETTLETREERE